MQITSSAPTRIDLAGGTLDIWPLYLFHDGAQTLNAAVSLRAHCAITSRDDGGISIRSEDTGTRIEVRNRTELKGNTELRLLGRILQFFNVDGIDLTTRSDSPVGAGIAGSSALNIAVCGGLREWTGMRYDDEELMNIAQNVEAQAIDVPTGAQDFRPAMHGGISAVELGVDRVRRIPIGIDAKDLEARLVLCYTGASRNSGINNWEVTKRHIEGDRRIYELFESISQVARAMRDALERADWDEVGRQISLEWEHRKQLAPGVTTPRINDLMARASRAGAIASKICGAGGGGCMISFVPPDRHGAVAGALADGGARVLPYRVETEGLVVRRADG